MTNKTRKEKLVEELEGLHLGVCCEYRLDYEKLADFVMKKEKEAVEYVLATEREHFDGDDVVEEIKDRAKVYLEG